MWEGMREPMVAKYNESEQNKRRWAPPGCGAAGAAGRWRGGRGTPRASSEHAWHGHGRSGGRLGAHPALDCGLLLSLRSKPTQLEQGEPRRGLTARGSALPGVCPNIIRLFIGMVAAARGLQARGGHALRPTPGVN